MSARNKAQELMERIDTIVGAAAPEPVYGPASSSGTYYTDKKTITAVQKKLESLGYFHGVVDGKYGSVTEAAIFNFSGQHGPPDDALLAKLGLAKKISFSDDEADSMVVQAKTATTPAQVQVVAAKIENLAADSPPDVQAEVAAAKQAAASAVTPAQIAVAKDKVANAIEKVKKSKGNFLTSNVPGLNYPVWQVGAGVLGVSVVGYGLYRVFRNRGYRR